MDTEKRLVKIGGVSKEIGRGLSIKKVIEVCNDYLLKGATKCDCDISFYKEVTKIDIIKESIQIVEESIQDLKEVKKGKEIELKKLIDEETTNSPES